MNTRSFRRMLVGACLILGPAVLVVVELLHPAQDDDAAGLLANVSESTTAQYWAHALALISIALVIPAVLGLVHMTRTGRPVLAHAGGVLAIVGLVAFSAIVGTEFVVWQAAKNPDTAAMTELIDQTLQSSGFVPLYLAGLAFPLGFLVLGIALQLTRTAPAWSSAALGVAPAVMIINEIAIGPKWLTVASAVVLLLGAGSIGRGLLTESDEAWEAVPATAS